MYTHHLNKKIFKSSTISILLIGMSYSSHCLIKWTGFGYVL